MNTPHKLNIKLPNGASFEAEGSEDTIQELFAALSVLRRIGPLFLKTFPPCALLV